MSKPIIYFKSPNGNIFYALLENAIEEISFLISRGRVKTARIERRDFRYGETYESQVDYYLTKECYDVLTLEDYRTYRQRAMELLYDIYDSSELETANTSNGVQAFHL